MPPSSGKRRRNHMSHASKDNGHSNSMSSKRAKCDISPYSTVLKDIHVILEDTIELEKTNQSGKTNQKKITRLRKKVEDFKVKTRKSLASCTINPKKKTNPSGGSSTKTNDSGKNNRLENELKKAHKKIKELQDEVNKLKKKVCELQKDKETLEIGQVAFQYEQAVATYVLPKYIQIGDVDVQYRMKAWMKKNEYKKVGKRANWKYSYLLSKRFKWTEKHEVLRRKLKKIRRSAAHPWIHPRNIRNVKIPKHLKLTVKEKEYFEDIVEIIQYTHKARYRQTSK